MRSGLPAAVVATLEAVAAIKGRIDSKAGKVTAAPRPRKNPRRLIPDELFMQ
jgi:predicted fused transcriptional regulator/phosphomethylpyrimidine kinase